MDQSTVKPPTPQLDQGFLNDLRRLFAERDAHCPQCGYDLCGIPADTGRTPRCPECGKNIRETLRIADTRPWRLPEMRRRAIARRVLKIVGLLMLIPVFVALSLLVLWLWFS